MRIGIGLSVTPARRAAAAPATLAELVGRAAMQRIDVVGIGDSNQIFGGHGWDTGFQHALSEGYAMYATALLSPNDNQGNGSGAGHGYNRAGGPAPGASAGAPAALAAHLDKGAGGLAPANYGWIAPGASVTSPAGGIALHGAMDPLGKTDALVFDLLHGTFADAATIRPQVRRGEAPWTVVAHPPAKSVSTGTVGLDRSSIAIPADAARGSWPLDFRLLASGAAQAGPFFGLYTRVHNPARTAGFSYHSLNWRGGQPLRGIARDLQQASDQTLTTYFAEVRRLQGAEKTVILAINSGLNDRNAGATTSVGPNPTAPGDSAAAFADNLEAIRLRLETIWALNGWPLAELHVLVVVSHPVAQTDDAKLVSYRAAAASWCGGGPRRHHVDLSALTDHDEMLAQGWYASASDKTHLSRAGYEALAGRICHGRHR